jgi:hypothetical protein
MSSESGATPRGFAMRFIIRLTLCLILISTFSIFAGATSINGTVFLNVVDPGNANDAANWNFGGSYATFTSSAIQYDSRVTGYTPAAFLNSPTFAPFNLFDPNADLNNVAIILTGRQWLKPGANNFYITHDDGIYLSIPDLAFALDASGPTSPDTTFFTVNNPGTAGLFNFTLNYAECCGAPAVLVSDLGATPEPGTLFMLGTGVLGLAAMLRGKLNI